MLLEASELAGIEERARANRALLELKARSSPRHHGHHLAATTRAKNEVDAIELGTKLRVAIVDGLGSAALHEKLALGHVEPKAVAINATIHLNALKEHLDHRREAFWAVHKASSSSSGISASAERVTT
jgi:hypothetical protein